jgi:acetyltransferase-like isoleucine patch superfamily enzyme
VTKKIHTGDLVLGKNVVIPDSAEISGGKIVLRDDVRIGEDVKIEVMESLDIGKGSTIGGHTLIRGRDIVLGREFYANHHAEIGGGSCFEPTSKLRMGYWCHLGSYTMINTAMPVNIGNEVGLGRFSNIYTHGAYLSALEGFPVDFAPVTIGSRVWLPAGTVNPGVTLGDNIVVGAGSIVTRDLPSGCLAFGTPCRVVRENAYPARLTSEEKLHRVAGIFGQWKLPYEVADPTLPTIRVDSAEFDLARMTVTGSVSKGSEQARNYLRRYGIRFPVEVNSTVYEPWREG